MKTANPLPLVTAYKNINVGRGSRLVIVGGECDQDPAIWVYRERTATAFAPDLAIASADWVARLDGSNADTGFGSAGTEADGSHTAGSMCDTINGFDGWHAGMIGALRADTIVATLVDKGATGCGDLSKMWFCFWDSADTGNLFLNACIGAIGYGINPKNYQASLYYFDGLITAGADSTDAYVYECDDVARTEVCVLRLHVTQDTHLPFPTYGPGKSPIHTAKPGNRILVRFETSTGSKPVADDYLYAVGKVEQIH